MQRREFLYDIKKWEARRIIRGYRKRNRFTHQLLAEVFMAAKYANPYRKDDGKSVADMFPQIFDDDGDNEQPLTPEEIEDMQREMTEMNAALIGKPVT